jgi:hypothetical protein
MRIAPHTSRDDKHTPENGVKITGDASKLHTLFTDHFSVLWRAIQCTRVATCSVSRGYCGVSLRPSGRAINAETLHNGHTYITGCRVNQDARSLKR